MKKDYIISRCLIQLYVTSPPSKLYFSKTKKELPLVALFYQEKKTVFQSGLSTTIWGKEGFLITFLILSNIIFIQIE